MALLKQTWAIMAVLSWGSAPNAGSFFTTHAARDVEWNFRCLYQEQREVFQQGCEVRDDCLKSGQPSCDVFGYLSVFRSRRRYVSAITK